MTRLLVSVRSAAEADLALRAGVDLIDIKEPARGALGPADPRVIQQVVQVVRGRVPVSAALGELAAGLGTLPAGAARGVRYAKLGLAGCAAAATWPAAWTRCLRELPAGVVPVAVAYVDWQTAGAPDPGDVIQAAGDVPCGGVLLDTFDKSAGGLLVHLRLEGVLELVAGIRRRGMIAVVGGSLGAETLPLVVRVADPDYVAVRGAACRGSRTGPLDDERLRRLVRLVAGVPVASAAEP
jgi:hypothetical protein